MKDIEAQLIATARKIMAQDFMTYPDYDPSHAMSVADAMMVLMAEHTDEIEPAELFDYLETNLETNPYDEPETDDEE